MALSPSILRRALREELAKFLGEVQDPALARKITDVFNKLDAQLDVTLSALRDALRGTGVKDFTTLEADIEALRGAASKDFSTLETDVESLLARVTALAKGAVFNTSVSADTNIFATALSPTYYPTTFRIYACFSAAGVLTVRRTSGAVTVSERLNSGSSLIANAAYIFDIIVESGESINLQYSVAATALCLKVVEVSGVIS